ncbi:Hsp70 family protein [Azoarcus sp. L1K30]|uniref:Hsp70 family protein n=1 Tax=Azoarcus sp. L1K30 TaxID=2820277 RepID=UPI001B80F2E7|nr:Hsp70 family protein [Azoarcus sp. L1K30]MBR0566080.1 Hsp70 family protein [Azoarcus sp. L1K30]
MDGASAANGAAASRYVIGIDLGTTHCALSFVDTEASDGEQARLEVLPIPQVSAPGEVENLPLLPSFVYLPHESELAPGDLDLPWGGGQGDVVGAFARARGAGTPIRMVASAKSWLCHPGVDRRGTILPVDAPDEVARISPFDASVRYLAHLRDAWNAAHPEAQLAEQDVTVTIPASFDPVARELTADAARAAGYARLTLLEEPQAALYSWIQNSKGGWRKEVKPGDIMLVVDVGGGTTDLSLIAIVERDGNLEPHRVAVGDHILLGGDNMDLALAYGVVRKLAAQGTRLDAWQTRALAHACRSAKETLLGDASVDAVALVVPSRGSKLIGGSIRSELTRGELDAILLEGFFPQVAVSEHPQSRARTALTQVGLPYAQDAAITRHLAAFLCRQREATAALEDFAGAASADASFLHPSVVLFNGGVLKSTLLAERLMNTLNGWLAAEGAPPARLLDGAELDLAVSRGAAYYGYVRRGRGVRIRGGTARAYYVAVESSMPAVPGMEPPIEALCLAPFGMEEGTEADVPAQVFGLVVGEPVRFRFFGSSVRRNDQVGTMLDMWATEALQELDEIEATLPAEGRAAGEIVRVRLHARITEAGTLELEALPVDGSQRWKVELEMRGERSV